MPRSVRVNSSTARSKLHRGKPRVIGRIPPGNRKKIVRPGTVVIPNINGNHHNSHFTGLPLPSSTDDSSFTSIGPKFLEREIKTFLFDVLQNNNKFPTKDIEQAKREENLLLKGEAALTLALTGYTTSRLTESIKGILNNVVEKPLNGSPVPHEPPANQFSFTFVVTPNAPQPLVQKGPSFPQYPKPVRYLIAALYVSYENSNNRNGIAEVLKQYRLNKDELTAIARAFKPFKLKELVDKLPGNK
jgi:hypothetical protein